MPSTTPANLEEHQSKYKPDSWRTYTIEQLGQWVHLLATRSQHRTDTAKKQKDLEDAQNYLNMMQQHLDDLKQ